jgi:hypothetical protein
VSFDIKLLVGGGDGGGDGVGGGDRDGGGSGDGSGGSEVGDDDGDGDGDSGGGRSKKDVFDIRLHIKNHGRDGRVSSLRKYPEITEPI